MTQLSMTYKNQRINGVRVLEKKRPYFAPRTPELQDVEGMPGAYLTGIKVGVLVIDAVLDVVAESPMELQAKAERISRWLKSDKPEPLVFDDEVGRTYYAVISGSVEPDRFINFDTVPITFLCPDPHKYAEPIVAQIDSDVITVLNNGSEPTPPIFRGTALGSLTNLDLVTLESYMRIGTPPQIGAAPPPMRTVLYESELNTTDGWSNATLVDNGVVRGTMISDGDGFLVSDYGTPYTPHTLQGPGKKRSLANTAQHFQFQAYIEQMNSIAGTGSLELYALNAAGNVVAVIAFEDIYRNARINRARLSLGPVGSGRREIVRQADSPPSWSDFDGIFELERVGSHWTAYFGKVDPNTGRHHTRANFSFWDYGGDYQEPIAQVQIAMRKWGDPATPATGMKMKKLRVLRFEFGQTNGPEYIAHAGDTIEINHQTGLIAINGQPVLYLKDFGADFFLLQPGENVISLSPAHLVNMEMEWRERW